MKCLLLTIFISSAVFSQQMTVSIDSNQYDFQTTVSLQLNPLNYFSNLISWGCLKKGTNEIDIYSSNGKINTITAPAAAGLSSKTLGRTVIISQTFINSDSSYEFLVNYYDTSKSELGYHSILFDNSGNQLWSDKGAANLGFDGKNTFIHVTTTSTFKIYIFRNNITSTEYLSKSAERPRPFFNYYSNGLSIKIDFPSGGNTGLVQLFDMLGRLVYSQVIDKNVTTIQKNHIPLSPFFVKLNSESYGNSAFIVPMK